MDQIKRGRGQHGPIIYFTEEERKEAIKQSKTDYMTNKSWYCNVCPLHNYKLANKWYHIRTQNLKKRVAISSVIKRKLEDMQRFPFQARIDNIDYLG